MNIDDGAPGRPPPALSQWKSVPAIGLASIGLFVLLWSCPAGAASPVWGADGGFQPFDAPREIQKQFKSQLPFDWFIGNPQPSGEGYGVMLHISGAWHGNPVSAARNLCPPRYSVLWRHVARITIVPVYHQQHWASVECP